MTAKKIPLKRKMTEAQLHRAVADYLAVALRPPTTWTTFPAGGGGKVRGGQLKSRGLLPGWPDIQVLHPIHHPGSVWEGCLFIGIELKTGAGRLSEAQGDCHVMIRKAGGLAYVCRSVDGVAAVLRECGIPLRAAVMAGGGWRKT